MNKKKLSAESILEKARVRIVCDAPFFGAIACGLPSELDESVGTACTDGTRIRYAPTFLEKLDVRQVAPEAGLPACILNSSLCPIGYRTTNPPYMRTRTQIHLIRLFRHGKMR